MLHISRFDFFAYSNIYSTLDFLCIFFRMFPSEKLIFIILQLAYINQTKRIQNRYTQIRYLFLIFLPRRTKSTRLREVDLFQNFSRKSNFHLSIENFPDNNAILIAKKSAFFRENSKYRHFSVQSTFRVGRLRYPDVGILCTYISIRNFV